MEYNMLMFSLLAPAKDSLEDSSNVQYNYHMHEHETIVVLEALMKWEEKLLGQKFTLVTDHKSLEYFKTPTSTSPVTSEVVGIPFSLQL